MNQAEIGEQIYIKEAFKGNKLNSSTVKGMFPRVLLAEKMRMTLLSSKLKLIQ